MGGTTLWNDKKIRRGRRIGLGRAKECCCKPAMRIICHGCSRKESTRRGLEIEQAENSQMTLKFAAIVS